MTGYSGWIQPIVVRRSGTHEQIVQAAASASVAAWYCHPDRPEWHDWLSGAFAKTVRRARPAEVEKVRDLSLATVQVGDAEALAMLPCDKASLPRPIAKLQVSGLDAHRAGWPDQVPVEGAAFPNLPRLVINAAAAMTTGKTCAQAAHGLFGWALHQDAATLDRWYAARMPFTVTEATGAAFATLRAHADPQVVIEDAGHTEVAPGTATVLVLPPAA